MPKIPFNNLVSNTDWLFLRNIICVAAGVLLWLYPDSFAKGVVIGLGALLIIYGVVAFLISFVRIPRSAFVHTATINALVSVIVGLAFILAPSFFAQWFITVVGILVIGLAILQLIEIIALRKYAPTASALLYLSPIVLLGLGILVVIHPAEINTLIGYFGAAAFIYSGLSGLLVAFRIRRGVKQFKEQAKAETQPIITSEPGEEQKKQSEITQSTPVNE